MNETNSRAVRDALNSIQLNYGFMLQRGYEVVSAGDYDLGWQVLLRKQDLFARIVRSRGEEEIYFRKEPQPADQFTDIGTVIYAATGEMIPRSQSSDPKTIQRYLAQIESYFAGEYVNNRDSLQAAQKNYSAAFSQGQFVEPPEPQAKPFFYYPLMAILILLILGGLVTLGMVLLDRLF